MAPSDDKHRAAILTLTAINTLFRQGELDGPYKIKEAVREVLDEAKTLDDLPQDSETREHAALAYQLAGQLYFVTGDVEDGLDSFVEALKRFETSGVVNENHARFLHDYAVTLHELSARRLALQYARRAQEMFSQLSITTIDGESADIHDFVRDLERRGSLTAEQQIDESRQRLRSAAGGHRADAAQALAVDLLTSNLAGQHVAELHAALETAFAECWRDRQSRLDDAVQVLRTMIELYWQQLPLPPWTGRAASDLASHSERMGRIDFVAEALTVKAIDQLGAGDRDAGLETLLSAIATHDEFVLTSESSAIRRILGVANDYARQFALRVAIERQDVALAAELIESARLQIEPMPAEQTQSNALRRSRVGNLRPVVVGGRSRIASHYRRTRLGPPVELLDVIRVVGGPDAAWWGCWSINERLYWALLLDGEWTIGELSLSEGTALRDPMVELLRNSPQSREASTEEILTGPWCRSTFAEEVAATELGEALIPEPLKQRIRETPSSNPISLVVAGNLFATVPLAALGTLVDPVTTRRVVEAAVIRLAPPAALVRRVIGRPRSRALSHPLRVACLDPKGDLPNSRQSPLGAQQILTGDPSSSLPRPTLAALVAALGSPPLGLPGLFYYSGHAASQGGDRGGDGDSLALYGGDALSAAQVFAGVAEGTGPFFPARVLLSACASSGARGAGAGEWLGLTAAVLSAGADQVVATTWPIWDTQFTSSFDRSLAAALQGPTDPAIILREAQLSCLRGWRKSDHDFSERLAPSAIDKLPFPLMWSAFVCIGLES